MNDIKYTNEELKIVNGIESGEFKSVNNLEETKKMLMEAAVNSMKKNKRVNIRISERDLQLVQRKALEEGIPYQTLISSLIHKYINDRLVDINYIK